MEMIIIIIKPATPFQEHWHGLINVWHLAKSLRKLSNNDRLLSNVGSIFLSLNLDYQKIDERAYCMSSTFFFLFFLCISASHAVICLNYIIVSSSLAIPLLQQDHRDHKLLTTRLYHKTYYLPATTAFFFFFFFLVWLWHLIATFDITAIMYQKKKAPNFNTNKCPGLGLFNVPAAGVAMLLFIVLLNHLPTRDGDFL